MQKMAAIDWWNVTDGEGNRLGRVNAPDCETAKRVAMEIYPDAVWFSQIYRPVPYPTDKRHGLDSVCVGLACDLYAINADAYRRLLQWLGEVSHWKAARVARLDELVRSYVEV